MDDIVLLKVVVSNGTEVFLSNDPWGKIGEEMGNYSKKFVATSEIEQQQGVRRLRDRVMRIIQTWRKEDGKVAKQ